MTGIETSLIIGLVGLIGVGAGSVTTGIITGRTKVSKEVCTSSMAGVEKLNDERQEDIRRILKRIEDKVDKRNGVI